MGEQPWWKRGSPQFSHLLSQNLHETGSSHSCPKSRGPVPNCQVLQVSKKALQPHYWLSWNSCLIWTKFLAHHSREDPRNRGIPDLESHQSCRVIPAPEDSANPCPSPTQHPNKRCREEPAMLTIRTFLQLPLMSVWGSPSGLEPACLYTEFSGKDSAGASLAGTSPTYTSCSGSSFPPLILSEVSTLASCPWTTPDTSQRPAPAVPTPGTGQVSSIRYPKTGLGQVCGCIYLPKTVKMGEGHEAGRGKEMG